jgi:hypothetical protein
MQEFRRFSFFLMANCPYLKRYFALFYLRQKIYDIPATFLPSLLQSRTADVYRCCAGYRFIFSCGAIAKIEPRPPIFDGFRPYTDTRPVELSTNDQPVVEAATYITHKQKRETNIRDHSGI